MARYRIVDPEGGVLEQTELPDYAAAHTWFKNRVPGDDLGYRIEVDENDEWLMIESADGGSNPRTTADEED